MATSPSFPSAPFVLTDSDTGANAVAEVTLTAASEITTIVASAAGSDLIVVAVSDANGANYVNVASVVTSGNATIYLYSQDDGHKLAVATATSGTVTWSGGVFPRHLPSGTKIKATRDADNDVVTLIVSGVTY